MASLSYNEGSVLEDAWRFIDRGATVEIVLTGWRAKIVRQAFPHYLDSLAPERTIYQRLLSFAKLVCFGGFCAPTLWAMCNYACQARMALRGSSTVSGAFIVTCESAIPRKT